MSLITLEYVMLLYTLDKNYIKIFTFLERKKITSLIKEHEKEPHSRVLQKTLAAQVTELVHGTKELENAIKASQILFSKNFVKEINQIDENAVY